MARRGLTLRSLIQSELFAEKQVFGSQLSSGPECQHEYKSEIEEHTEESPQGVPHGRAEHWRDEQREVRPHGVTILKRF